MTKKERYAYNDAIDDAIEAILGCRYMPPKHLEGGSAVEQIGYNMGRLEEAIRQEIVKLRKA